VGEVMHAPIIGSIASSDRMFAISDHREVYRSGESDAKANKYNPSDDILGVATIVRDANGLQHVHAKDLQPFILPDMVSSFKLGGDGWLRGLQGKRVFWVPVDLRAGNYGNLVTTGNIVVVPGPWQVPMFDVSACI
ncbi:hypothetical protein FRB98_004223, partial [Tulasnella sp. 332]